MKQAAFAELFGNGLTASPLEVHQEDARRLSNKLRVLARLKEGPATTMQLVEVGGIRASGRVHELRGDGYVIDCDDLKRGLCVYTLVSSPKETR